MILLAREESLSRRRNPSWVLGLAMVPLGLAAYATYLWARFGEPLVFIRQQDEYWGREPASPLATAGDAWEAAREGFWYVMDPVFLFADEPTSRLDPVTQREVAMLLRACAAERGLGVLLVTHDAELARKLADRVLELRNGALRDAAADGPGPLRRTA